MKIRARDLVERTILASENPNEELDNLTDYFPVEVLSVGDIVATKGSDWQYITAIRPLSEISTRNEKMYYIEFDNGRSLKRASSVEFNRFLGAQ